MADTSTLNDHENALRLIEELTKNADAVQERVLAEILAQNADTEYLKGFDLGGATDRKTFKSTIPMVVYEDIQPLIKRIATGDSSPILSAHPISEFLTSSGTSAGERKMMPTIAEDWSRRRFLYSLLTPVMSQFVEGLDKGKGLYFYFVKSETVTPGGLLARPVLTSYYKSGLFKARPYDPFNVYTSPDEAILCEDTDQSMYAQMLCGLYDRDQVNRVGSVFASGLIRAIRFLQVNWRVLCRDIRTGSLNPRVSDRGVRDCMARVVRADPKLADFIAGECEEERWEGIVARIWPNTKYIDVVLTGAMAQYIPTIDYYTGSLPKVCTMYASSECYFGLNLKPVCDPSEVSYTIMPNMGYFEFLPNEIGATRRELVDLADVEVGKEYELVVTTYAGLYRYRVGDLLRVTGFHNSAPQFQFLRRKNVLLSIDSEKTDEGELQAAVENASQLLKPLNASVVEYTSCADTSTVPGHYVIYLELLRKDQSAAEECMQSSELQVLEQCCLVMEETFNAVYRQGRVADKSIGALEIRVVKNGTFEELMDFAISRGASINQYKTPRCVSFAPITELLNSRVISAHFSPSPPHWTPTRRF